MIYFQVFANSCNNCFMDKTLQAIGTINWVKKITVDIENSGNVGYLLSADHKVFVVTQEKIIAFDNKGDSLWERLHWPFSPVSLRFDNIFFTSVESKSYMQSVDYNNNIRIENFWMPEVIERSFLVLFEPVKNGLIAQVQFQPDPDDGPIGFVIYRIHDGALGKEWQKTFKAQKSKVIPILNNDNKFLVTTNENDAFIFNINDKGNDLNPVSRFSLPLEENTRWLSSDKNGKLYWLGEKNNETILKITDTKGNLVVEWNSEQAEFPSHSIPILPAIVTPEIQYILTKRKLFALKSGERIWELNSGDFFFSNATALKDNSILLVMGSILKYISPQGKVIFEIDLKENIVTAPVVDEEGQIYVASSENVYAIK